MADEDLLAQEAYDEAMDSLSRSQRNELLGNVSQQRAEAKHYQKVMATGPNTPQERGFWKTLLRINMIAIGWTIEYIGKGMVFIGQKTRELGESL